jgi:ComEC/Rec2-related protein
MRAAVMASVGIAGLLLGRVDRPAHLIGFSALVLLAWDPDALFQAGFQMSYAATLGLALGMPAVEAGIQRWAARSFWPKPGRRRRYLEGAITLFAAGFIAQAALSPILIFYFRRISWVAPFANLAAVPWGELCLTLGAVLFAFDLFGLPGARFAALAADKAALGLWKIAAWTGKAPGAEVPLPWSIGQVAVLSVAVAGTFVLLSFIRPIPAGEEPAPPDRRFLWTASGLWFAAAVGIFLFRPPGVREVLFLWPRTRGDTVVAVSLRGAAVMDPGSAADVRGALWPFLREHGVALRHVIFRRPSKGAGEAWKEIQRLWPGAQAFGACPESPCAEIPGVEIDGVLWRRESGGALSASAGKGRFLFLPEPRRKRFFGGSWDAVSFHPRGPARAWRKSQAGLKAGRWILWGRGGESWEAAPPPGEVRRVSRDGYLLWRSGDGRWEE